MSPYRTLALLVLGFAVAFAVGWSLWRAPDLEREQPAGTTAVELTLP